MKKDNSFNEEHDIYSVKRVDDVVIFNLAGNLLERLTYLRTRDKILDFLDRFSQNNSVKVLVIINSPDKTGRKEYLNFYRQALTSKLQSKAIHRIYNAFDQITLKLLELDKIVVYADCGEVIQMFLNISFVCDYRIIADDTVFQNAHLDLGLLPKGGGVYFLSKMLGCSKMLQFLIFKDEITASEALQIGIVDKVVKCEELATAAFRVAKQFATKPARTLSGVKRLLNYCRRDLKDYLEFENEELLKIVGYYEISSDLASELHQKLEEST